MNLHNWSAGHYIQRTVNVIVLNRIQYTYIQTHSLTLTQLNLEEKKKTNNKNEQTEGGKKSKENNFENNGDQHVPEDDNIYTIFDDLSR